MQTVLKDPIS